MIHLISAIEVSPFKLDAKRVPHYGKSLPEDNRNCDVYLPFAGGVVIGPPVVHPPVVHPPVVKGVCVLTVLLSKKQTSQAFEPLHLTFPFIYFNI